MWTIFFNYISLSPLESNSDSSATFPLCQEEEEEPLLLLMLSSFKVFLNRKTSYGHQIVILPAQRSHWCTQTVCWVTWAPDEEAELQLSD